MLELRDAREPQRVRTAFERATIHHQQLRRTLHRVHDGLHPTAYACETTHPGGTDFFQSTRRQVGQFAGVRTAGTGQHAGQRSGRFCCRWIRGVTHVHEALRRDRSAGFSPLQCETLGCHRISDALVIWTLKRRKRRAPLSAQWCPQLPVTIWPASTTARNFVILTRYSVGPLTRCSHVNASGHWAAN